MRIRFSFDFSGHDVEAGCCLLSLSTFFTPANPLLSLRSFAMVARQRPRKASRASRNAAAVMSGVNTMSSRPSRLPWLLAILALSTTLLIALQFHRRGGGTLLSSSFNKASSLKSKSVGEQDDSNLYEMRKRIAALSQQFQKEFGSLTGDERKETKMKVAAAAQEGGGQSGVAGMAIVPGEGVVDHSSNAGIQPPAVPPHVEGKSTEEAERDRRIGLEDFDQDTLKAMYDFLNGRG